MNATIATANGMTVLTSVDVVVKQEEDATTQRLTDQHELVSLAPSVVESTLTVRNDSDRPVTVLRMDAFAADLVGTGWTAHWFTSAWGQEFTPHSADLSDEFELETRSGRSSNGAHPWLGLERDGAAIVIAPAWSGNWHMSHRSGRVAAGISPWSFATTLQPGEETIAPSVVVAAASTLTEATVALTGAIGRSWIPRTTASDSMRVEWNHWWPYEDAEINAEIIDRNAEIAARLGIRQITVDAGWFGPSGDTFWEDVRGDWDEVNTDRFPDGLAPVGQRVRDHGAVPGIWLEAEAVGPKSTLRRQHPQLLATSQTAEHDAHDTWSFPPRDPAEPGFLGYVCLGSPAGREFVLNALDAAVDSIDARWLKLDFNLDPGTGCTRTDHGHGARDGLYRHYLGLYEVLDTFRDRHPDVILESCSSGGLRIDLGMARHVHCSFLSDPDYTEHHLQVFWGAAHLLPPAAMLHWSWSQWRGDYAPAKLDFATITIEDFDTTLRAAMLQRFGVSLRLTELRPQLLAHLGDHVRLYLEHIAPILRSGVIIPLTGQPLRDGGGERTPAFRATDGDRHIVAVTVLSGGLPPDIVRTGLDANVRYSARDLVTGQDVVYAHGSLRLVWREGQTSCLVALEPDF